MAVAGGEIEKIMGVGGLPPTFAVELPTADCLGAVPSKPIAPAAGLTREVRRNRNLLAFRRQERGSADQRSTARGGACPRFVP